MAGSLRIRDVGDEAFDREVIARSATRPVVVDFWAPWCRPCRTLGPTLERLADEHDGAFDLVKVNVDTAPETASRLGIQSIPAVVGFRDGVVVADFLGAQPESVVRHFLAALLPTDADRLVDDALELPSIEAEAVLRQALTLDARHAGALLALARLFSEQARDAEALDLLGRIGRGEPSFAEAQRLAAVLRTRLAGRGDEPALRARLATTPEDLGARLSLGVTVAARGRYEAALAELLVVVRTDRHFRDEGGRRAMLDIFEMLGPQDMLTQRYQSALANVLFR